MPYFPYNRFPYNRADAFPYKRSGSTVVTFPRARSQKPEARSHAMHCWNTCVCTPRVARYPFTCQHRISPTVGLQFQPQPYLSTEGLLRTVPKLCRRRSGAGLVPLHLQQRYNTSDGIEDPLRKGWTLITHF